MLPWHVRLRSVCAFWCRGRATMSPASFPHFPYHKRVVFLETKGRGPGEGGGRCKALDECIARPQQQRCELALSSRSSTKGTGAGRTLHAQAGLGPAPVLLWWCCCVMDIYETLHSPSAVSAASRPCNRSGHADSGTPGHMLHPCAPYICCLYLMHASAHASTQPHTVLHDTTCCVTSHITVQPTRPHTLLCV